MDKDTIATSVVSGIAQINIELISVKSGYESNGINRAVDVMGRATVEAGNL